MMSSGNTATPPQAIGSCQPTKVSPLTDAGAAVPWHHTGRPVATTPALSRTTPSVTSAVTPRRIIRMHRMSPKMPAVVTPMASATAMQPSGIASMAARVEIGLPQLAGVARSSRTGTKRNVKAGPINRLPAAAENGIAPRIQQCRMPFLRSIVVMVAVVTFSSLEITSDERLTRRLRCANATVEAGEEDRRAERYRLALGDAGEPQAFHVVEPIVVARERIGFAVTLHREVRLDLEKLPDVGLRFVGLAKVSERGDQGLRGVDEARVRLC